MYNKCIINKIYQKIKYFKKSNISNNKIFQKIKYITSILIFYFILQN